MIVNKIKCGRINSCGKLHCELCIFICSTKRVIVTLFLRFIQLLGKAVHSFFGHLPPLVAVNTHLPTLVAVNTHLPTLVAVNTHLLTLVAVNTHLPPPVVSSYPSMTKLKFARNQYDAELTIQVELRQDFVQTIQFSANIIV